MEREAEGVFYELTRKRVKNLNLRVTGEGEVRVSAPPRVPQAEIDRFVTSRREWILRAQEKAARRSALEQTPQRAYTDADCLAVFREVSGRIWPQFADVVPTLPEIRARRMKSRWGVCHLRGHYITLNTLLLEKPMAALEYVVMHEYVHFLYPNHQAGFHAEMARRMPDYKARRALLE